MGDCQVDDSADYLPFRTSVLVGNSLLVPAFFQCLFPMSPESSSLLITTPGCWDTLALDLLVSSFLMVRIVEVSDILWNWTVENGKDSLH